MTDPREQDRDRRCAEIVGKKTTTIGGRTYWHGDGYWIDSPPRYSTDIAAAMELVEWAIAHRAPLYVNIFLDADRGWRVDLNGSLRRRRVTR